MAFRVTPEHTTASGTVQKRMHQQAAETAFRQFGPQVFLRGVVEVSNYCRENCDYCGMRRDNRNLKRFRATADQITEMLLHHRPDSLTDINFQTGEDPVAVREIVLPVIRHLRRETSLGLSVCLGTLDAELYGELREAGASIYIIKFELAQPELYKSLHAPGTLDERIRHIRLLAGSGWHVSSGFIAGLPGQSMTDLVNNFELAASLPLAGCSVSPFIPGESTPLVKAPPADLNLTLNCMALLRLTRPDWVIPAVSALNLAGTASPNGNDPLAGYRRGLRTGANLVTMNLTPSRLRDDYLLYKRDRFIMHEERILEALEQENLAPSKESLASYYARTSRVTLRPAQAVSA